MVRYCLVVLVFLSYALGSAMATSPGLTTGDSLEGSRVQITVPNRVGGSLDFIARTLASFYDEQYGTRTIIRNVEGLSGEQGIQRFLGGDLSWNEWLILQETVLIANPIRFGGENEPPFRGLELICTIAKSHFFLIVAAADDIQSFEDFLDHTRCGDAGSLLYGTGGVATLHHLAMEEMAASLGLHVRHIPYRSNSHAVQGLVSGDVRAIMAGSSALPLVRSGDFRIIAVTAPEPMEFFPGVPPVAKYVTGFEARNWFALFARQGLEEKQLQAVQRRVEAVVAHPDFLRILGSRYQWGFSLDARDLEDLITRERQAFRHMIDGLQLPE